MRSVSKLTELMRATLLAGLFFCAFAYAEDDLVVRDLAFDRETFWDVLLGPGIWAYTKEGDVPK